MPEIETEHELNAYYAIEFPSEMKLLIVALNRLRGKDPDNQILAAVQQYIGLTEEEQSELDRYFEEKDRFPEKEGVAKAELGKDREVTIQEMISIAMLGLLRIHHDHVNQTVSPAIENQGYEVIALSNRVAEKLNVDTVPQFTIDNNGINWSGELARDNARTYVKIEKPEEAHLELEAAIQKLAEKKERTHGEESIWALLNYELGALNKDLAEMSQGLQIQRKLSDHQFNRERLMYLSKKVGAAILNPNIKGTPKVRLQALSQVLQGVVRTW